MSMEAYALCDRPLRSIAEWQTGVDACGFDLKFCSTRDLATSRGHLPASWRGREAGFECSMISLSDLTETYDDVAFGGPWSCVYAFYYGTLPACAGTWIAVAACIALTGGMAFDPQEGVLLDAGRVLRYAHDTVSGVDKIEARLAGRTPH